MCRRLIPRLVSPALLFLLLVPGSLRASPAALAKARTFLETAQVEEAFFALEDAPPQTPGEETAYAKVLTAAAELLVSAGDPIFALQLGTKALAFRPELIEAHLVCLQAALEANSLDEANVHLAALESARPNDPAIVLWRARLALADAEWATVRRATKKLAGLKNASEAQQQEAMTLTRQAQIASEGEAKKLAALARLEKEQETKRRAMRRADRRARAQGRAAERATTHRRGSEARAPTRRTGWAGAGPHVILYCDGSWRCRQTRARLQKHKIDFELRNVGTPGFAIDELKALGFTRTSTPIYLMHGEATPSFQKVLARLREHDKLP